jgi:kynurenine 3-monooxygenase
VSTQNVNIVGAGLAGALLAVMLARRGFPVTVYERRPDPRCSRTEGGRSINLALAARGIRALQHAGVMDRVRELMIPMRGRMVHEPHREPVLLPYGQHDHEVIYSVGRGALNRLLIEAAARHPNVTLRFEQACLAVDPAHDVMRLKDSESQRVYEARLAPTIATDGAGSAVRNSLVSTGLIKAHEDRLDHDYKELTIPSREGRWAIEPNALHVWPRGGFMLIALPNTDGSFTATLFLPKGGEHAPADTPSFATLGDTASIRRFFEREFPDALVLIPTLIEDFYRHPQGQLGTVHTAPWHVGGKVLLLGDAAHAIVPFHGQGMNAAFEDCLVLDQSLNANSDPDWSKVFATFESRRRPNTAAIAQMALENYTEMRHKVLDDKFLRQKKISLELEKHFPTRFIPRYSMVMFHPEISYAEALRRGGVQQDILDVLDDASDTSGTINLDRARPLIEAQLPAVN